MNPETITVRKSPFVFLKLLVIIEFFFALLPFLAAVLLRAQDTYDSTGLALTVPYPLLVTIAMTSLQVLIIGLAFIVWYFPAYQIDRTQILHRRANLFEDRKLANTRSITRVEPRQGLIGRRLNYGSLVITTSDSAEQARLKDVTDPVRQAELIRQLVEPERIPETFVELPPVSELITNGENQRVEFKSSLVWDYRRQEVNKALYEPVMKNVVAFMNTKGGTLLIGVGDDGELLGLEPDFKMFKKPDSDGFENVFNMAFNKMIGVEFRQYVDVTFPEIDSKVICVVSVRPSTQPVYLAFQGSESFYIRTGNSSQPLTVSKAAQYIQTHFTN